MSLPFHEKATEAQPSEVERTSSISSETRREEEDESNPEAQNKELGSVLGPSKSHTPSAKDYEIERSRSYHSAQRQDLVDEDDRAAIGDTDAEKAVEEGFEVSWDGDNDPMNPRTMSTFRKWVVTLTVSISSLCV